jgi:hypothetical protein
MNVSKLNGKIITKSLRTVIFNCALPLFAISGYRLSPIVASPCRVLLQLEYKPDPPPPPRRDVLLGKKSVSGRSAAVVTLIKRLALRCIWSRSGSYRPLISGENVTHKHKYVFIVYSQSRSEANIHHAARLFGRLW